MNLAEFRQKYPQYKNIPDQELATGLYNKFYAGKMSREDFDQKIGLSRYTYNNPWAEMQGDPNLSMSDLGQMVGGAVSQVPGTVGDVETLARQGLRAAGAPVSQRSFAPTTQRVEDWMMGAPTDQRQQMERELGATVGGVVTPAIAGKAIDAVKALPAGARLVGSGIGKVANLVPTATGRIADEAAGALKSDTSRALNDAIANASRKGAAQRAVEDIQRTKPDANILEVRQPNPDTAKKLTQARRTAQESAQRLTKAKTELDLANTKLAAADKYNPSPSKSSSLIRGLRGIKARAEREFNEASAAHEDAQTALREAQAEHKTSLQASRKVEIGAKRAAGDAAKSQKLALRLKQFKADIEAPNAAPNSIASNARSLAKLLHSNGDFTTEQYKDFVGKINDVMTKVKSRDQARHALLTAVKALLLTGGVGELAGLSYEIRRSF